MNAVHADGSDDVSDDGGDDAGPQNAAVEGVDDHDYLTTLTAVADLATMMRIQCLQDQLQKAEEDIEVLAARQRVCAARARKLLEHSALCSIERANNLEKSRSQAKAFMHRGHTRRCSANLNGRARLRQNLCAPAGRVPCKRFWIRTQCTT